MNALHSSPMPPELLEPARALPDFDAMDDVGDYAEAKGREALEGMLIVDCPEAAPLRLVRGRHDRPNTLAALTQLCFVIRTGGDVMAACEGAEAVIACAMGEVSHG